MLGFPVGCAGENGGCLFTEICGGGGMQQQNLDSTGGETYFLRLFHKCNASFCSIFGLFLDVGVWTCGGWRPLELSLGSAAVDDVTLGETRRPCAAHRASVAAPQRVNRACCCSEVAAPLTRSTRCYQRPPAAKNGVRGAATLHKRRRDVGRLYVRDIGPVRLTALSHRTRRFPLKSSTNQGILGAAVR